MTDAQVSVPVSRRAALRVIGGVALLATASGAVAACGAAAAGKGPAAAGKAWAVTGGSGTNWKKLVSIKGTTATLVMRGDDIWNSADTFTYLDAPCTQKNGTWICLVQTQDAVNAWTKTGIMARQSLDPGSMHVYICVTPQNGVKLQHRDQADSSEQGNDNVSTSETVPIWLRLDKQGDNWSAATSTDGKTWGHQTAASTNPIALGPKYLIGIATTAHDATQNGYTSVTNLKGFTPLPSTVDAVGTNDTAPL